MKCSNCGMELSPSSRKCSRCGSEAPQGFNYSNMENELLNTVLEDEVITNISGKNNTMQQDEDAYDEEYEEAQKQPLKLGAALLVSAALFAGASFYLQTFSTEYQYETVQEEYQDCLNQIAEEDYAQALKSADLLLETDADSLEYLALKNIICEKSGDSKTQAATLKQIIAADADNYPAYEQLLQLYLADGNQKAIAKLAEKAPNSVISSMLREHLADVPYLELTPGVYDTSQMLTISSENGNTIFYTLDGTPPQDNGRQYYGPVPLEQDQYYKVRAVCRNKNGTYGEEAAGDYQIGVNADISSMTVEIQQPEVYPASGVYDTPQTITINVPIGYQAYYSWMLGTMLTPENGTQYTGGIPMPEGESILSVIVADGNGNSSTVKQIHYTYAP